jgi:hypothetical protein
MSLPFIRVRDKRTQHEYDAPEAVVALHPENYTVLKSVPAAAGPRTPKPHVKKAASRTATGQPAKSAGSTKKKE